MPRDRLPPLTAVFVFVASLGALGAEQPWWYVAPLLGFAVLVPLVYLVGERHRTAALTGVLVYLLTLGALAAELPWWPFVPGVGFVFLVPLVTALDRGPTRSGSDRDGVY